MGIPLEKINEKPTGELYRLWKEKNLKEKDGTYHNIAAVPSVPHPLMEEPNTLALYPDLKNLHLD